MCRRRRPIAHSVDWRAGLLAHVLVSKYCDHLQLYRQSQLYARDGVRSGSSTLADLGSDNRSVLLRPLVDALLVHVLVGDKLHARRHAVPCSPGRGTSKQGGGAGCGPTSR